ncbi:MAG: hypothetical protein OXT09_37670 [Myxococcales bacterium]|nr:hypothetical protein [Myxococcales bacterium]
MRVLGMDVRLWIGPSRDDGQGMLLLYWHGVGGLADEATAMLGSNLQRILDAGGMVASFSETLGTGTDSALGTWYEDDFAVADAIIACAIEQHGIDPRRIHVAGCGLGAFQAGAMLYARSSYLASGVLVQGGVMAVRELETADHVPALITSYDTDDGPISFVPSARRP